MTNIEKIKRMDPNELAIFLINNDDCTMCVKHKDNDCVFFKTTPSEHWQCVEKKEEWLLQEVSDD